MDVVNSQSTTTPHVQGLTAQQADDEKATEDNPSNVTISFEKNEWYELLNAIKTLMKSKQRENENEKQKSKEICLDILFKNFKKFLKEENAESKPLKQEKVDINSETKNQTTNKIGNNLNQMNHNNQIDDGQSTIETLYSDGTADAIHGNNDFVAPSVGTSSERTGDTILNGFSNPPKNSEKKPQVSVM